MSALVTLGAGIFAGLLGVAICYGCWRLIESWVGPGGSDS